jgi:hypothetical protein
MWYMQPCLPGRGARHFSLALHDWCAIGPTIRLLLIAVLRRFTRRIKTKVRND